MDQDKQALEQGGIRTWVVEAVVAAILLLVGLVVMYENYRTGAKWGPEGPESGYFPFYVGLLIAVCSAVTLVQSLAGSKTNRSIFVEMGQLKLVMAVLVPCMVYVLLIHFLGIYVAAALFIGAFMAWQGKFGVVKILPVALGVSVALFLMFEVWFKIPLPKGPLEAALGY